VAVESDLPKELTGKRYIVKSGSVTTAGKTHE
jgi:hypothetical protein